jgi:uncharacterized protein (TIGR02246 family)
MERMRERWTTALNEGSADEFARCVTPNAVWLPPRGDAVEGRKALIEWLEPLFGQFRYEFSIKNVDVRQLGDWAVEEADFHSILHPKQSNGEGQLVHDGRYLLIWRRMSDDWLIDRYVDRTAHGAQAQP